MHVCMWYFEPDYSNSATVTTGRLFNGMGDRFCEHKHFPQKLIRKLKKFVNLGFRHHEGMPFRNGTNVEKRKEVFVLGDLVRGNLSGNYF